MGKLFSYDGKLMQTLLKITDAAYAGLLWFLFSIPLITIGASTTALYYTVHKALLRNRGYIWQEFWNAFKSNFRQATIAWLLVILFAILAFIDFYILRLFVPLEQTQNADYILLCIMLALVIFWASYLFPYIARFEDNTKTVLKNSFFMAFFNLPWTCLLLIVFLIAIIGFFACPPLLLLIAPTYMCIANLILERIFKKYLSPEALASEDELNNIT